MHRQSLMKGMTACSSELLLPTARCVIELQRWHRVRRSGEVLTARKFGGEHPHRGGAPVTKIGAGANCGRGNESEGEPGPKTKLLQRISVAGARQSFGTTAVQGCRMHGAGMRR